MTPTQNTTALPTASAASGMQWNSPVPYLFGGMFVVFGIIACALVIIVCSYKKPFSTPTATGEKEKPSLPALCREKLPPEIVVVMPGDTNPTYLAKPLPPTPDLEQV